MKRLIIGFLVVMLALGMMVSCSSDDDDDDDNGGGISQPPTSDWRYAVTFSQSPEFRYGYIYVFALDETDLIESCNLTIDGEDVSMYYQEMYNEWWANYEFTPGQSYAYDLDINNGAYAETATLTMTYIPTLNIDDTWDGQTNYELTWTLEANSDAQSLFILGPDDESRSIGSIYIDPALRAYTLAANLHGFNDPTSEYLNLSVDQENWVVVGDLVFLSFTYNVANWGTFARSIDPHEHARTLLNQVMNQR